MLYWKLVSGSLLHIYDIFALWNLPRSPSSEISGPGKVHEKSLILNSEIEIWHFMFLLPVSIFFKDGIVSINVKYKDWVPRAQEN